MKELKVSDIQIIPFRPRDGHIGFASLTINDAFSVSDIALFTRPNGGLRLGFPLKTLANGVTLNIFRPLSKEIEAVIEAAITDKYESLHECNGIAKETTNGKPTPK